MLPTMKRLRLVLVWISCCCWLAACVFPIQRPVAQHNQTAHQRMKDIHNYIVYYGNGRAEELARYDLAIIQPDTLTGDELAQLKAKGTMVVAYLSIGEVEPGRPWYSDGRVDQAWILGQNENWGSYYVDAEQAGWQSLMVTLAGDYLRQGFDGIFLDTMDTVDLFPATSAGMISLVEKLHQNYPDALLVQNRGFTVVEQTAGFMDALMFEDLSTIYHFAEQRYDYTDNSDTAADLIKLQQRTGLTILALDYVAPDNPGGAARAVQIAQGYGFVPAVSVINLDDLPDYGLDQGGPANLRISKVGAQMVGETVNLTALIENTGLSAAKQVTLTVDVNGSPLNQTVIDLNVGERYTWQVPWPGARENAQITFATPFVDDNAINNVYQFTYTPAALGIEPLLPPDQQKRRPASNGPDLTATRLVTPPVIDGKLDEWTPLPCITVDQPTQLSWGDTAGWQGPQDLSGRACYAWDAENLYVALQIKDDVIVQQNSGADLWQGDHVELWFDTQLQLDFDNAEASEDDFQLGISPGDGQQVPPDFVIFAPAVPREAYIDQVQYKVVHTADGYTAEIRIPATVLVGLRLANGHAIGATFEPSDTDTPGASAQELMMSSAPQSSAHWGDPTLWNNLFFQ